jgi:uncharacterized membrane protein YkvA (DUF1232 family)
MDTANVDSSSFWRKIKQTAGLIPFADEVVAIWYCARDPATPVKVKATLLGAVAYFVLPFDALPDFLAGLGYTDDFAVVLAAFRAVRPHIRETHRERARDALRRVSGT